MTLLNPLKNLLGLAPDRLIDSVAGAVDRFVTTDAERAALRAELTRIIGAHHERLLELEAADRRSARDREAALGGRLGAWVQNGSAALAVLVFLCVTLGQIWWPPPAGAQRLADLLTGALAGIVGQLFQYWFGVSTPERRPPTPPWPGGRQDRDADRSE